MAGWDRPSAWRRFVRHLPEVLAVVVVVSLLDRTGTVPDDAAWLVPALLVGGAALISAAYGWWGSDATPVEVHLRAALQVGTLTAITYATGWGAALATVQLFAVADNVKYSGSDAARVVTGWAVVGVAAGELAVATGLAPVTIGPTASHTVAVFSVVVLAFVGSRIRSMTIAKERAETDLTDSEARFRSLVQQASDVIMVIGDAQVTYVSPSVQRVLGYPEEEVLGVPYLDLVHPADRGAVIAFVTTMLDEPDATGLIECRLRHATGRWVPFESNCHNLLHDPQIAGFVITGRDMTERKALEDELEHRAFHDALTDLPNLALFRDRLEHTVARSTREDDLVYGVLYLDLDDFKLINDTLGHTVGDGLLVHVAELLADCVRDPDTAARLGGDEFAILLEGMRDPSDALGVAQRVLAGLDRPVTVAGHEVKVHASIGIAISEPGQDAGSLLRDADIAMYVAKSSGKGTFQVYDPALGLEVVERLTRDSGLDRFAGPGGHDLVEHLLAERTRLRSVVTGWEASASGR